MCVSESNVKQVADDHTKFVNDRMWVLKTETLLKILVVCIDKTRVHFTKSKELYEPVLSVTHLYH